MQRTTFNRKLILHVLSEQLPDCGDNPPYSASSVHYTLEQAFNSWEGIYKEMKSVPSLIQVHRTLRDLWHGGAIVGSRVKEEPYGNGLPHWVVQYQCSADAQSNYIKSECLRIYNKVNRAKHGFNLFGAIFDKGIAADEVPPLLAQVKSLMQKTHSDKCQGFDNEFKMMKKCSKWIREGLPLPTPTHSSDESHTQKLIV